MTSPPSSALFGTTSTMYAPPRTTTLGPPPPSGALDTVPSMPPTTKGPQPTSTMSTFGTGAMSNIPASQRVMETTTREEDVIKTPDPTWFEWLTQKPAPKSPAEIRVETYVAYMQNIDKLLMAFEAGGPKVELLQRVEFFMAKIRELGDVDGDLARFQLEKVGIRDQRRMDLEKSYQDLLRVNGQQNWITNGVDNSMGPAAGQHQSCSLQ